MARESKESIIRQVLHLDLLVAAILKIRSLFGYTHCNQAGYNEGDKSRNLHINHRSSDSVKSPILHRYSQANHEDQINARQYCLMSLIFDDKSDYWL